MLRHSGHSIDENGMEILGYGQIIRRPKRTTAKILKREPGHIARGLRNQNVPPQDRKPLLLTCILTGERMKSAVKRGAGVSSAGV